MAMTPRFEPERFVDDLRAANREADPQRAVNEVLGRAISDPRGVLAGLGEPSQAGLQPLYRSDELTVLNVVWAPLMLLLPHDHNMWASIGIYTGREDNILWQRKGEQVEAVGAASLCERQVFPLPRDAVHSVTNPIPRLTGAIHVYGGDFFAPSGRYEWDPETLRRRPWDLEAARARFKQASERFAAGR
jgi:predicted metal-dependent enzyme (double-stranded beta helix superfamily)